MPFRTREEHPISENNTVRSLLEGLFLLVANAERNLSSSSGQDIFLSAVIHDLPQSSVVHIVTFCSWLLVIPRETTLKDILTGARWPRDSPLPFEDGRETPSSMSVYSMSSSIIGVVFISNRNLSNSS